MQPTTKTGCWNLPRMRLGTSTISCRRLNNFARSAHLSRQKRNSRSSGDCAENFAENRQMQKGSAPSRFARKDGGVPLHRAACRNGFVKCTTTMIPWWNCLALERSGNQSTHPLAGRRLSTCLRFPRSPGSQRAKPPISRPPFLWALFRHPGPLEIARERALGHARR